MSRMFIFVLIFASLSLRAENFLDADDVKYYRSPDYGRTISVKDSIFCYDPYCCEWKDVFNPYLNRGILKKLSGDGYYLLSSSIKDIPELDYTVECLQPIPDDSIHIIFRYPEYERLESSKINNVDTSDVMSGILKRPFYIAIKDPLWVEKDELDSVPVVLCDRKEAKLTFHKSKVDDVIVVYPVKYVSEDEFPYFYHGLTEYPRYIRELENCDSNNLIITFPDFTEKLFERYFFYDEMLKMTEDYIYFRGKHYVRIDKDTMDDLVKSKTVYRM